MNGPGQAGSIGTGIHTGLFGTTTPPGAGGQGSQQLLLDLGTDSKSDDRRPPGNQIVDDAVELSVVSTLARLLPSPI